MRVILFKPILMKKTILFVAILFMANYCIAQEFPFGTYYYLPAVKDSSSEQRIKALQITAKVVTEKYFKNDFVTAAGGDYPIDLDRVVRSNNTYFLVVSPNGKTYFAPAFLVNIDKKDTSVFAIEAYQAGPQLTVDEAVRETTVKSLADLRIPLFTRAQMQRFAKLPSIDKMDVSKLKVVLENMLRQMEQEQARIKEIYEKTAVKVFKSRLYETGSLRHFALAGFNPFITRQQYDRMEKRIKANDQLNRLWEEIGRYK